MTRDVLFAPPHEDVDSLLSRMTDRRIRHLPVSRTAAPGGHRLDRRPGEEKIAEVEAEADGLKAYIAAGKAGSLRPFEASRT